MVGPVGTDPCFCISLASDLTWLMSPSSHRQDEIHSSFHSINIY